MIAFAAALFSPAPVRAWDHHQSFMAAILEGLPPATQAKLAETFPAPCEAEDRAKLFALATKFTLNLNFKLPLLKESACPGRKPISMRDVLLSRAVDEPDFGMDQDLPPSADPLNEREYMGGVSGPSSQGFRHMYFAGVRLRHPIASFQIPMHTIGQAPERVHIFADAAADLIRSGEPLWGARLLAWSLHYLQDLAQPYHDVQIPSFRMLDFRLFLLNLFHHPMLALLDEGTRVIGNYHWAYEQYTLNRLMNPDSPYNGCIGDPEMHSNLKASDRAANSPEVLALGVSQASRKIGHATGVASIHFFGTVLKSQGYDLVHNQGSLDYGDLAVRPDLLDQRVHLQKLTCVALGNAVIGSRALIQWVLKQSEQ